VATPGRGGTFATRAGTRTTGRRCSSAGISNLILTEEAESPHAKRPCDEKTAAPAAWLIDEARRLPSATRFVDEFAWRILATGLSLLRVTLYRATLNRQFFGAT
jgi:hypothetical protein